jgi:hypothetical protein
LVLKYEDLARSTNYKGQGSGPKFRNAFHGRKFKESRTKLVLIMTMKMRVLYLCVILFFLVCGSAGSAYAEPFKGPWEKERVEDASSTQAPGRFNPLRALVKLYAKNISPIDGKECPMYPSCSAYSLLCFEKHGLIKGWVMTCDRLLHEADEMREAPIIYINGMEMFDDPLKNNDFWWHSER